VSLQSRQSGGQSDGADGPRVLQPDSFAFELDAELRRAVRTRNYLTLVVVEAGRDTEGPPAAVDDTVIQTIVETFADGVRDTDLMGYLEHAALGLVLLDADFERSTHVIDRVMSRLDTSKLDSNVRIAVGAACYPSDGVDAGSLAREAKTRPVASCRGRR
jgi:PleD family two-component response regulator